MAVNIMNSVGTNKSFNEILFTGFNPGKGQIVPTMIKISN